MNAVTESISFSNFEDAHENKVYIYGRYFGEKKLVGFSYGKEGSINNDHSDRVTHFWETLCIYVRVTVNCKSSAE